MKPKNFYMPPEILIGTDCVKNVGEKIKELNLKKGLLVTDKSLIKAKVTDKLIKALDDKKIQYVIFDETKPNPTTNNVARGLKKLIENKCDFVITCGGGSAHDCGKAVALVAGEKNLLNNPGTEKKILPIIAVNTTAGTGSEVTNFAVITDEERHTKMTIVDSRIMPTVAVDDPVMMASMPKSLTAASGMDALTHAIEAYLSVNSNPLTDSLALQAIQLIFKNLGEAVENGSNINAREKMAYAQCLAGMAFNNAGVGNVHAIAHQLGGLYDLPHGLCNAVLLPYVLKYYIGTVDDKLCSIASCIEIDTEFLTPGQASLKVIDGIKQFSKQIGIPQSLKEIGVKEADFTKIAKGAVEDICARTSPKRAEIDDIVNILKSGM